MSDYNAALGAGASLLVGAGMPLDEAVQATKDLLALDALVVGSEDRIVLQFPPMSREQYEELRAELDRAGFGGRVLVACGAEDAIVLRATKAEGSTVGQCADSLPPLLPGSTQLACHLAHGHSGQHSNGETTWTHVEASADGTTAGTLRVKVVPDVDDAELQQALVEMLRRHIRLQGGGDVRKALGS